MANTVPYPWPHDGDLRPSRLALVVAGAQRGWRDASPDADRVTPALVAVASALREADATVVYLRHRTRPDRSRRRRWPPAAGGDSSELVLPVEASDVVVDAGGIDGFHQSDLDAVLRERGADRLCLAGYAAELAVDSTQRSANDRGYECLVLSDAVAPLDRHTGARTLATVTMSGGIFGAVGTTADLLEALDA